MVSGLNQRARSIVYSLKASVSTALAKGGAGVDLFCVAGDLFDTDHPSPALIDAVQGAFCCSDPITGKVEGGRILVVNGNHDMTSEASGGHTAILPLRWQHDVKVFTGTCTLNRGKEGGLVIVPHRVGPAKDWLENEINRHMAFGFAGMAGPALANEVPMPKILVVHLGLEDENTPPWLRGADDSIHVDQLADICVRHSIGSVVAGNWHTAKTFERRGVVMRQIGALVPTGFDNPGMDGYGRVVIWEDGKFLDDLHVPGDRFLKVSSLEELADLHRTLTPFPGFTDRYVHAQLSSADWWPGKLLLDQMMEENLVTNFKTSRSPEEVRSKAKAAAEAVVCHDTLGEALESYLDSAQLPEAAYPPRVRSLCQKFLQIGGRDGS